MDLVLEGKCVKMRAVCNVGVRFGRVAVLSVSEQIWYLYALRCADDSVYTGITTDLHRRVDEHNAGRGARYTAGRSPVRLIGAWQFTGQSAAAKAEARFKRLSRARKLRLIVRQQPFRGAPFEGNSLDDGPAAQPPGDSTQPSHTI